MIEKYNQDGSVTVWDSENNEWVKLYSLASHASRFIPEGHLVAVKEHFMDHCWLNKGTGNESG